MKATKNKTILIIEDNPGDQLLLQQSLLRTGLSIKEIVLAETLEQGIMHLNTRQFSIVFLDLFLPDSQGIDSLPDFINQHPEVPVIIYSGLSDAEVAVQAITLGAQDFLIKGEYDLRLLKKTVRYSIERKLNMDALQVSNERYTLVSKATHDMIWHWDLISGEVHRNGEGWRKIFNTLENKEIGTKEDWMSRIHPSDQERVTKFYDELIRSVNQDLFEVEHRIIRDDGTVGYIEDRGFIIRNTGRKIIGLTGATHDITKRKIAEEKVALSEKRFKSLVQNGADIICIVDVNGNYIYVSSSCESILGFSPEHFLGQNAFSFIHPADIENASNVFAKIFSERTLIAPMLRLQHSNGEWRWIESSITNLLDDPSVCGIVINSRDVTEKKLANDEIEKLSLIAKETINGVVISDQNDTIVWINEAFTKMYGYTLEEVIGKHPRNFLQGPETSKEDIKCIQKNVTEKKPFTCEILNYTKEGKKILVKIQVQPILDENGAIKQFFAMETDITLQRKLEEEVEAEKINKQKQITEAVYAAQEKERSEIARELHDNVNQLLGATRLYIDMAKDNGENRISLLSTASEYTMDAIEEIRKLSKTLITPLVEEISLFDAIKDLTTDLMMVHEIDIQVQEKTFNEENLDDKFKLNVFRIVQEQLNNTIKHSKAKTVFITINDICNKLSITMTDNGVGFDVKTRKTGVGLMNIKSRSDLFNGKLLLESQPGKGTSLSIEFDKKDCYTTNELPELNLNAA